MARYRYQYYVRTASESVSRTRFSGYTYWIFQTKNFYECIFIDVAKRLGLGFRPPPLTVILVDLQYCHLIGKDLKM